MVLPTGDRTGPFLANADSTCAPDQTYTLLDPGRDGGLVTGTYQPEPSPAFDADGNSLAAAITGPARFFGVAFSASTNPVDPQTGATTNRPRIAVDSGALSGDLTAFAASWNRQEFHQGTTSPTGTYDPATGRFTLEWISSIHGGPFDRFAGLWHLEGTFVPAAGGAPSATTAPPAAASDGATIPPVAGGSASASAATAPPAPIAAGATAPEATASPSATAPAVPRADDGEDGWAPPAWLVVVLAAVGLLGGGAYVGFDRQLRRVAT
jgi:hypothetical protein